jgi:glyoxylase-like metal-dependent hydrolase (beta-lactamase superfamily II)
MRLRGQHLLMAEDIPFDRAFSAVPGVAEQVAPGVRRVLAPNPGPFTFSGTCTYIVGQGDVAIIDPGPDIAAHIEALQSAVRGERIAHILVTHSHSDHSRAAPALRRASGAPVLAEGPHRLARPLHGEEANRLEAGRDLDFVPDRRIADGETVQGRGYALEAVATPGHAANHLCFALKGSDILFSGDHVMAWSTPVVAPPDGSMRDYMNSLRKLRARPERTYFPGHGGPVRDAPAFVDKYIAHRAAREAAILRLLARGEADIPGLVRAIYIGLDARLASAAGLSVFAHLEDLVQRGEVATDGEPSLTARYRLSGRAAARP